MPTKEDIVTQARSWLGTRWVHQGRTRTGIDCVGLVVCTLTELEIPVDDRTDYRRSPKPDEFLGLIRRQTSPVSIPEPGDMAVFRQDMFPCHVGIFAMKNDTMTIIHAYANAGKVIEEPFANEWPQLLIESRSFGGIE